MSLLLATPHSTPHTSRHSHFIRAHVVTVPVGVAEDEVTTKHEELGEPKPQLSLAADLLYLSVLLPLHRDLVLEEHRVEAEVGVAQRHEAQHGDKGVEADTTLLEVRLLRPHPPEESARVSV